MELDLSVREHGKLNVDGASWKKLGCHEAVTKNRSLLLVLYGNVVLMYRWKWAHSE